MRYGPSYIDYSFPCCLGRTTSFKTKLPSCISLGLNLELYIMEALCLAANSQTWAISFNSSIRYAVHFKPTLFSSSLSYDRLHKGVSISAGSIMSDL